MSDKAVARAQQVLSVRDRRSEYFPAQLFDEHAWDLLLYLFLAARNGGETDPASVGKTLRVRTEVLERWIKVLEQDAVVVVKGDFLRLTDDADAKMEALLSG
ncbi:hypothetical protein [Sphingomonas dokdonensis]|uniref:Uncharacterized protein n=1 Tax=Sphingomonas dokdonensis TaxID=344880 RepID=A0A245ZDQ0_9SPHN|nr:hypothetical protein [Sphingomonas dokdonensis]OWK27882.1 hypothetical protein SPDO_29650 [Sphingomonas dokdonensis]